MIKKVQCKEKSGSVRIPASKSWAHRLLIIAALSDKPTDIVCDGISDDIEATMDCLCALGAVISTFDDEGNDVISVTPIDKDKIKTEGEPVKLLCKESGSTLRFLLPLIGALGANVYFVMEGRLKERPLEDLTDLLCEHGMLINKDGNLLFAKGKLRGGEYSIRGDISSQFISGLLMALPVLKETSKLIVTGEIQSKKYIEITKSALSMGGANINKNDNTYEIVGQDSYCLPEKVCAESDWSSAAFFLSMGALSDKGIVIKGMNPGSIQGDRAIIDVLIQFGADITVGDDEIFVKKGLMIGIELDASEIPDLVPVISAVASLSEGTTRIYNAQRLRLKESDRIASTAEMIRAVGGDVTETEDGLLITGRKSLKGGTVDSFKDHRIAMSAAVLSSGCENDVIVTDAECTDKSFKNFWDLLETV